MRSFKCGGIARRSRASREEQPPHLTESLKSGNADKGSEIKGGSSLFFTALTQAAVAWYACLCCLWLSMPHYTPHGQRISPAKRQSVSRVPISSHAVCRFVDSRPSSRRHNAHSAQCCPRLNIMFNSLPKQTTFAHDSRRHPTRVYHTTRLTCRRQKGQPQSH